jgi:urease accessory protein
MKLNIILFFLSFVFFTSSAYAHTFTGMVGFYDGLSHPVLGIDHFLAMVSVGIVSAQIGGRAIWTIPATFVLMMIVGGIIGMLVEVFFFDLETLVFYVVEFGIVFSVILLGLAIAIERKISTNIIMIFISIFGMCHGLAHGMEMPWAVNPILFALGFASGTATLHLFGVGIGSLAIKTKFSSIVLRIVGAGCALFGMSLLI